MPPTTGEPAGVLVIDKPRGWTSHDVVAKTRGLTRIRQIGHSGTLDPMATGVLVLCIGWATRLLEYLSGQPKTYRAAVTLGITTDTYDADGEIIATCPVPALDTDDLQQALDRFRGEILQTPPAFSAIKQGGEAAYKRARRGEAVELQPRPVTIYRLDLLSFDGAVLEIDVTCSAGTYIRSLAHDLGETLGCGAHLSALCRTAAGSFSLDQATTLDDLAVASVNGRWTDLLLPPDQGVAHLPAVKLSGESTERLLHGQSVAGPVPDVAGPARVYDETGCFVAIASYQPAKHAWKPLKVFSSPLN